MIPVSTNRLHRLQVSAFDHRATNLFLYQERYLPSICMFQSFSVVVSRFAYTSLVVFFSFNLKLGKEYNSCTQFLESQFELTRKYSLSNSWEPAFHGSVYAILMPRADTVWRQTGSRSPAFLVLCGSCLHLSSDWLVLSSFSRRAF